MKNESGEITIIEPSWNSQTINLADLMSQTCEKLSQSSGIERGALDINKIELCMSWEQHSCFGYDLYDPNDYGIKVTAKLIK